MHRAPRALIRVDRANGSSSLAPRETDDEGLPGWLGGKIRATRALGKKETVYASAAASAFTIYWLIMFQLRLFRGERGGERGVYTVIIFKVEM